MVDMAPLPPSPNAPEITAVWWFETLVDLHQKCAVMDGATGKYAQANEHKIKSECYKDCVAWLKEHGYDKPADKMPRLAKQTK